MKKIIFICFTICFFSIVVFAQSKPFEAFDRTVRAEKGGFSGNKENLSKAFNEERIRLGADFESELWNYLGDDVEKHYWIGSFLQSKSYLHGSEPLRELALKVWQNNLEILKDKQDEKSVGTIYKTLVASAVLAHKSGKSDLALRYKEESSKIIASGFETSVYFPAMSEYERCIFQNIGGNTNACQEESESTEASERIINSGIINGKTTSLPYPKYPEKARSKKLSGMVKVRVLVDVDGKVISAEGVEGHPELFEAAIEAAKKAKFKPTLLSGVPVRVSGFLVYRFVSDANLR